MVPPVHSAVFQPASSIVAKHRGVMGLLALVVLSLLLVLTGLRTVGSAAALFALADSANPYFVPAHAGLLYLWTPIVVTSACLLFLSPGLFLSLALNAAKGVGQWVLSGFALSLIVVSAVAGITQWLMGSALRGHAFAISVFICSLGCFGFLLVRLLRGHEIAWPLDQEHARATLLSMVIVPLLLLLALTPKFYWESFNGDGAHAFETARLLLHQLLPFWSPAAGDVASYPGLNSMLSVYPAAWFVRSFGEVEVSARLPLLLYLVPLYGAILALVEHGRSNSFGLLERWLLWFGLVVYVVVIGFSATYSPYSADIALPASRSTLLMVCFLGFTLAFLKEEWGWIVFFLCLTYLTSPNGLLLVGLWLFAVFLVWRPRPWRQLRLVVIAALGCVVGAMIAPFLLEAAQLPVPGNEHTPLEMLKKLQYLQWADYRRIVFLVVPSGILPAVALLAWWRQDRVARTFTVVTITYFAFFYFQLITALHYFVPTMILPLVVFWRNDWVTKSRYRPLVLACAAGAIAIALWVSLPVDAFPDTSARRVGASIKDTFDGYGSSDPASFRRSEILEHLFPVDWSPSVPSQSYGGSPLAWNYYAHQSVPTSGEPNYVIAPADQPAPPGMRLLAQGDNVALYLRSDTVWAEHRALRPSTLTAARVYMIPRDMLFRGRPMPVDLTVIDLLTLAKQFELSRNLLRRLELDY